MDDKDRRILAAALSFLYANFLDAFVSLEDDAGNPLDGVDKDDIIALAAKLGL